MSESDTSERENVFYEVKKVAGKLEHFYDNREFFWQESQSTLSKWLWIFLGVKFLPFLKLLHLSLPAFDKAFDDLVQNFFF